MKRKPIMVRLLTVVLSVILAFNNATMTVTAADWNNSELSVKRNTEVAFSELIKKLVADTTAQVNVTITQTVNGTDVSKTVSTTTNDNVAFYVGDVSSADANANGVSFATGGSYALVKGVGTVNGTMTSEAEAGYKALEDAAKAADGEVEAAQNAVNEAGAAVLAAEAATIQPGLKKTAAENAYEDAAKAVADAQEAYDNAVKASQDAATARETKQAELDVEKEELAKKEADLTTAQNNLSKWKTDNGFDSQEAIQDAIIAKQAEIATTRAQYEAASGWDKAGLLVKIGKLEGELGALQALPNVLAGLEDALAEQQAEVTEQQEEVDKKQAELDAMTDEEVLADIQKDIDEALEALEAAKSDLATKTTAKDNAVAAYEAAQQAVADAESAKTEAENTLATKQTASNGAWAAAKDYVNSLTAKDITFDVKVVTYTKSTDVKDSYPFTVKVYDELKVTVVDEQNSMTTLPTVTVTGADKISENVYKVFEGKTATITVPSVSKYRFSVSGATGSDNTYTVGPVTQDTEVKVTYTEIGASSVIIENPTGAVITVNDSVKNLASGESAKAGTELAITVTPDAGYTVTSVEVTDKNNQEVTLTNNKFITSTKEENTYTITATTKFTGSIVNLGSTGEYIESVSIEVDGKPYTSNTVIAEGGKTVTVKPIVKTGYAVNDITVTVTEGEDNVVISNNDGTFSFTANAGCKYVVSFTDENIEDIRSSIKLSGIVENASVKVKVEGEDSEYTLTSGAEITEINPGTLITVTITPNENHYITKAVIDNGTQARATINNVEVTSANGVKTLKFRTTAESKKYFINVSTDTPVVAPNTTEVVLNKYDIITGNTDTVEVQLFSAFDKAQGITSLEYEYLAGVVSTEGMKIHVPAWGIIPGFDIPLPEIEIPIWRDINEKAPTVEEVSSSIATTIKEKISADYAKYISTDIIKSVLGNLDEILHFFGAVEEETVRAIFEGSDDYQATTSISRIIKVQDLRTEVDVEINEEIAVVYGSYISNTEILAKLLAEKMGVNVSGTELDDKYDAMLSISKDMVGADVGTYTVEVAMADTDYDYKDAEKVTATITVTKADATVTMTSNNVILYENLVASNSVVNKDYLMQITPDVVITDEVAHLAFLMGLDANTSDSAKPAVFATVDLSATELNTDILGVNLADALIKVLGGSEGMTLSELLDHADDIKSLLATLNMDTSLLEDNIDVETLKTSLKALYAVLEEYSQYGDVYVKFVNDEEAVVPDSHGIYLVGAVTTDSNYNTAANATVIVITAEPVFVKFDDANDNNARQFVYDGTKKYMTAKAYDENNKVLKGTMKYIYAGVQSDGTAYLSTEAPMHAGSYTVVAMFNDAGYYRAGFAVGVLAIWPSDVAEVGVENKIVVYDENNEVPVSIKDMITVLPEGTDAKIAVITAGIDVATDFSEEGFGALEGVVNIDFPERADTILKKVVPSAYTEEGITFETLKNKLVEIQAGLEGIGMDASAMDQIITAIGQLPDSARLTFHNTYYGTVNEKALPNKIGAYLVTAVIFDPDYLPEAGAGVLLITPDVTEATLEWTYNDMNGIITQPVLDKVSLSAEAKVGNTFNEAATEMIKYVFVGLTKDGEISTFVADQSNIAEVSRGLRNGAYTQIAYIWNGVDATMTVAKPIVREFVHTPQQIYIDFEPDENIDNVRLFTYTGKPVEMPVVVEKLDGSEVKAECLEIRYVGVDSKGNEYDSSTAPTNVGTYVVTVTYKEYDMVPSYSLKYAGIQVGVMIIEPAKAEVLVIDQTYICDENCECECVEDGKVVCGVNTDCACHKDSVAETSMITVTAGDYLITVVVDEEGNVNILMPESWNMEATCTDVEEIIAEILVKVKEAEGLAEDNVVSTTIGTVIEELEVLKVDAEGLDEEAQEIVDAVVAELEAFNVAAVKEIIEQLESIDTTVLSKAVVDEINEVIAQLEELVKVVESAEVEVASVTETLEKILNSVNIKSVSINGEESYICGTYKVYGVAFGPNHQPTVDDGVLTIECEEVEEDPVPTPTPDPTPAPEPNPTPGPDDDGKDDNKNDGPDDSGKDDGPSDGDKDDSKDDDRDDHDDDNDDDSNDTESSKNASGSETGDNTPIVGYILLLVVASVALVMVLVRKRRSR